MTKITAHSLASATKLPLDFVTAYMVGPVRLDTVGLSLGRRHASAPETPKQRRARLLTRQEAEVDRDRRLSRAGR